MLNRSSISKRLFRIMTAAMTVVLLFANMSVLAVNEGFDNPDDDMVSQNEAFDDLLYEPLPEAPEISGTGYILYDAQSGTVLMGRGIRDNISPASTSIIMTVLLAIENLDPEESFSITQDMYIGIPEDVAKLGLTEGETVTVNDMIYAAMLNSASDACLALAIHISGSEAGFCSLMNSRAAELGCANTTFSSCYGNGAIATMSSPLDMALILDECTKHDDFRNISTTFQHTMAPTNMFSDTRVMSNANRFISTQDYSYPYYIGGKTGYADNVGYILTAAAERNGRKLIGVIMGSTNSERRYQDMISLFEFGYMSYTTISLEPGEFSPLYNDTIDQINGALLGTELGVIDSSMEFSNYTTTTTARAALGSSNTMILSNVVIDTLADDQYFEIPICKVYTDGKKYIVGVLHLHVAIKDKVIEVNPEKHTVWGDFKKALITVIVILVLFIILLISLRIYRKKLKQRSDDEYRRRSRML